MLAENSQPDLGWAVPACRDSPRARHDREIFAALTNRHFYLRAQTSRFAGDERDPPCQSLQRD